MGKNAWTFSSVVALVGVVFAIAAAASAPAYATESRANPCGPSERVYRPMETVTICGSGFGSRLKPGLVVVETEEGDRAIAAIKKWRDSLIEFHVPYFPSGIGATDKSDEGRTSDSDERDSGESGQDGLGDSGKEELPEKITTAKCFIQKAFSGKLVDPVSCSFRVVQVDATNAFVKKARSLKEGKAFDSDKKILEALYTDATRYHHYDPVRDAVVGYAELSPDQVGELKKAGFGGTAIQAMRGDNAQYAAVLDAAAVWLGRSKEIAFAPMIRVFLQRKSYEKPYKANMRWFGAGKIFTWERINLNLGYTLNEVEPIGDGNKSNRYVLVGIGIDLNRSASINVGGAATGGDTSNGQWYVGLSVDSSFLGKLGYKKE